MIAIAQYRVSGIDFEGVPKASSYVLSYFDALLTNKEDFSLDDFESWIECDFTQGPISIFTLFRSTIEPSWIVYCFHNNNKNFLLQEEINCLETRFGEVNNLLRVVKNNRIKRVLGLEYEEIKKILDSSIEVIG